MKIVLKIVILLLLTNSIKAQFTIIGQILSNETKEPLSYVNIGIKNSNTGTVSDENGNFKLQINSQENILVISFIGYHSEELTVHDFKENTTILLKPSSYLIDEIKVVSTSLGKDLVLGARNEKERGRSIGFGNAQLGAELGALIQIEKETFVKSINVVLNHAKGDSLLLRVNIYDYKKGKIGKKILQHNIYIKEKQRKGTFTVNLEEYQIVLSNDILLSVEWLRDFDENGNRLITFDSKKSKKYGGTFIRYSKTMAFTQVPYKKKYKPCLYLIGKQSTN